MAVFGHDGGCRRLVLATAAMLAYFCAAGVAQAAELAVSVTGLRSDSGRVAIAVFSGSDGFPDDDLKAVHRAFVPIDPSRHVAQAVFKDLIAGEYAVAVFHDDNNSGKLETNFLGMPRKGYGFSNNARPAMRPPNFEEARISLPAQGMEISIGLRY